MTVMFELPSPGAATGRAAQPARRPRGPARVLAGGTDLLGDLRSGLRAALDGGEPQERRRATPTSDVERRRRARSSGRQSRSTTSCEPQGARVLPAARGVRARPGLAPDPQPGNGRRQRGERLALLRTWPRRCSACGRIAVISSTAGRARCAVHRVLHRCEAHGPASRRGARARSSCRPRPQAPAAPTASSSGSRATTSASSGVAVDEEGRRRCGSGSARAPRRRCSSTGCQRGRPGRRRVVAAVRGAISPISDVRCSAEYRVHMVEVFVRRALAGGGVMRISVTVNGRVYERDVDEHWTLLRVPARRASA